MVGRRGHKGFNRFEDGGSKYTSRAESCATLSHNYDLSIHTGFESRFPPWSLTVDFVSLKELLVPFVCRCDLANCLTQLDACINALCLIL